MHSQTEHKRPKIKHFSPIEVEKMKAKLKLVPKRGIF